MQVHGVKGDIVCASNGGCDSFDINRSLAEGLVEINREFSDTSLVSLALGIIVMQRATLVSSEEKRPYSDCAELLHSQEI